MPLPKKLKKEAKKEALKRRVVRSAHLASVSAEVQRFINKDLKNSSN